jgi:hypothetical protein
VSVVSPASLAAEPLHADAVEESQLEQLDRGGAVEPAVTPVGEPHHAHAPLAERALEGPGAEALACTQRLMRAESQGHWREVSSGVERCFVGEQPLDFCGMLRPLEPQAGEPGLPELRRKVERLGQKHVERG